MKIEVIQTSVDERDLEGNLSRALKKIDEVESSSTIILPELFNSGYRESTIVEAGERSSEILSTFQIVAKDRDINIILGSIPFVENSKRFNRSIVIDRSGDILSYYNKTHLFKILKEDIYFTPGDSYPTFNINGVNCGIEICYDLRFPEVSRIYYNKGVKVLFIPAAWPHNRVEIFKKLLIARAIENQLYIVAVNRASSNLERLSYGGNSMVINPMGEILSSLDCVDGRFTIDLDLDIVDEYRETIKCLEDRRDDLFKIVEN